MESVRFIVPSADLERVKATIREEYPNALIGTKQQPDGSALVDVSLYASDPERPGGDALALGERPQPLSLSELVEKAKRAQH
ncbi:MAG: hypothetical protein ACM3YO_04525 [Bacteroidota bacterium]